MEYLRQVLGITTTYGDSDIGSLPNYIHARYNLKKVKLDNMNAVFAYPKGELDAISSVRKHLSKIEQVGGATTVLVLEKITYRQKEYLLRDRIPFIVDGKQVYLPFMATYLQERCDAERTENLKLLPSAQLLLLYYIYQGCGELVASDAVEALEFTSTSISRASRQLVDLGLVETEKRGVQKVIFTEKTPQELFDDAREYLENPVKRKIYIPKDEISEDMLLSGYSALAEYSMLGMPNVETFAVESISELEKNSSKRLQNSDEQCAVELWRYNPHKLANGECVDRLSLALALADDDDERVEQAVDEMLEEVWREIDGKGNRKL